MNEEKIPALSVAEVDHYASLHYRCTDSDCAYGIKHCGFCNGDWPCREARWAATVRALRAEKVTRPVIDIAVVRSRVEASATRWK